MAAGTHVGAYRLVEQIGEGGMGAVWLAEHTKLGRRAAIKLLHPSYGARPEIVTRFFNEARAATAIADPGIVQIFDFGHHTDGSAYIVMELLEGETLHARMRSAGLFSVASALRVVRQIAGSLGAAHARGIVHRDLKPENIFLVRDAEVAGGERAKILDFGIAKLNLDPSLQTNASLVIGTPAYMSPEQCRGAGHVDQRSDVYALGCILFALITGRPPFVAAGGGELIAMHLTMEPPRPSELVAGLDPEVEQLIMACLDKEPGPRPGSGTDLAGIIGGLMSRPWIADATAVGSRPAWTTPVPGSLVRPRHPVAMLEPAPTTLSDAAGASQAPASTRKSRRAVVVASALVATGLGVTAYALLDGGATPEAPVHTTRASAPPAPAPAPPAPPSPDVLVAARLTAVLARFTAWARDHAGAACPDATTLGATETDPWGHPIQLTCTDQPANQRIGAVSAGPDGVLGTDDDIASWSLGRDVTDSVRGARWVTVRAPVTPPRPHPPVTVRPPPSPPVPPPVVLDENGIPIHR